LRADRLYNAPDTELDFTEQGGLMWGDSAVGKLVAGADPLRPRVQGFVDEEAGPDVAAKVERRLQHFIDRKIASLFEPLLALQNDETLTGLARGFAFRMVEAQGILPRAGVAADVKQLDQEARGALRKHGIRFGQFTVFQPLLLKPAPTRLRLVLWSLALWLDEFPESPPPGLVTLPVRVGMPEGYHTMSGYHAAGERAIRIDMLERLADMVRAHDTRSGFEATADMLSITGMTLEQFATLMQGLGYAAERGERPKQRAPEAATPAKADGDDGAAVVEAVAETATTTDVAAAPAVSADAAEGQPPEMAKADADVATEAEAAPDATASETSEPSASVDTGPDAPPATDTNAGDYATPAPDTAEAPSPHAEEPAVGTADVADAPVAVAETEVFYTFRWQPPRRQGGRPHGGKGRRDAQGTSEDRPRGERKGGGKPKPDGPRTGKPKSKRPQDGGQGAKTFAARPPRAEKKIDPDNPFAAALMGLRDKS
jgi:ATP-dependent RNA helicase SUPV3L1/SUV3